MTFNGVTLTDATVQATRRGFADNCDACVREVEDGTVKLGDHYPLELYRATQAAHKRAALAGEWDHTLTFRQRAHFIQTGESVALLP